MHAARTKNPARYLYVDFLLVSALQRYRALHMIVDTYDIYCQYMKKFRRRLELEFTPTKLESLKSIESADLPKIVGGVGNYHAPMHIRKCRCFFSLHHIPGVGKMVGEQCEGHWGITEPHSRCTKEMSCGHRHEYICYLYSHRNVQRIHRLGESPRTMVTTATHPNIEPQWTSCPRSGRKLRGR